MTITIDKCNRCGGETPRRKKTGPPKTCAKCHSPYWNKPRKYKLKRLATA